MTRRFLFCAGLDPATAPRFRVFAGVHCEQSLYFTGVHDETIWRTTHKNVPGRLVYDPVHLYQDLGEFVLGRSVYTASAAVESLRQYFCLAGTHVRLYDRYAIS